MTPSLALWSLSDAVAESLPDGGLINETFRVTRAGEVVGFLQRLNTRIFVPEVHEDIAAITEHVAARGLHTPRLAPTAEGRLWHTADDGGVWRLLTPVGDRTVHRVTELSDARSAGALVARWHSALSDFAWSFRSVRAGAHDTPKHMAGLRDAVATHVGHRLHAEVEELARTISAGWGSWTGPTELPTRVIHGDLKISNVRFSGPDATALIDLDTCAWGTLDVELGDALRSWCNRGSEDMASPSWDLDVFVAAMEGYASAARCTPTEWAAIVPGCERICWELAARFARDALEESYFGFDPAFGGRGEHNLLRARGQAALAASVRAQRGEAEAVLARLTGGPSRT